jgi:hypothetical protein
VSYGFADKTKQTRTQIAADRVLSHPDLLRHILSFAIDEYSDYDKPTLAKCLRVNSAFFDAAGYHLYRQILVGKGHLKDDADLSEEDDPKPDRPFKGGLLKYTQVFKYVDHYAPTQCATFCKIPVPMPNLRVLCVKESPGSRIKSERRAVAFKSIPRNYASIQSAIPNAVRNAVRDAQSCPMLRPLRPRRLVLRHWYHTEGAFRFAARFDRRAQHCLQSVTMIHRSKDTLPATIPNQIKIRDLAIAFDPDPSRLWPPPRAKAVYTHCATICIRSTGQVTFTNTESLDPEQLGECPPKVS